MPFMIGRAPVRRTLKYLEACKIIFRDSVKIFSINYNVHGAHHQGARDFVFWNLPQVQYKNPNVQCITFKNLTPSPFLKIFLDNGKSIIVDMESRNKEEIVEHLSKFTAICKTSEEIDYEELLKERKSSSANFGHDCERFCICEVLGQVPCSALVPLPKVWKRKGKLNNTYRIPPSFMELGLVKEEIEEQ